MTRISLAYRINYRGYSNSSTAPGLSLLLDRSLQGTDANPNQMDLELLKGMIRKFLRSQELKSVFAQSFQIDPVQTITCS